MDLVAARFHGDDRDPAGAVPELGVDRVLLDRIFSHGVHRRRVPKLVAGDQRSAVQQNVVAVFRSAADIHFVCRPVMIRLSLDQAAAIDDRGIEKRQLPGIAGGRRQFHHHLFVQRKITRSRGELNRHRRFRHGDHFVESADLELHVHRDIAALRDDDVFLNGGLESRHFDGQRVG